MDADDVVPASRAILRSDFGDRRLFLRFATEHPACRALVAEGDGEIVGTAVGSVHGPVGWVGAIWTDPTWRGKGIGSKLTDETIAGLLDAGCRTLVLVASQQGLPMYERRGFEIESQYHILEADGLDPAVAPVQDPRIRAFAPGDLEAMAALDLAASGEDRRHLLAAFAESSGTRVLDRDDGTIGGFVVRAPWGGGATIAEDPVDALAIIHARRLAAGPGKRVRAGVLSVNRAGLEALRVAGWAEAWSAPRLVRGDPLDYRPLWLWGQFNHALG